MNVLRQFSEKEEDYHLYQARQNYQREQRTILWEYEQNLAEALRREREERAAKEQERAAKEEALREKQQAQQREQEAQEQARAALAEIERLKALLAREEGEP